MRDPQCHACELNNVIVTSRDSLEINCWTFQNTHYFTWPASPHILSRVLPSLALQIACHGVNPLSCQCETCFREEKLQIRLTLATLSHSQMKATMQFRNLGCWVLTPTSWRCGSRDTTGERSAVRVLTNTHALEAVACHCPSCRRSARWRPSSTRSTERH